MKRLSETQALKKLDELRKAYRDHIAANYEHKAISCLTCETQGSCCLDAHFVNVHISRLEAVAIQRTLAKFSAPKQGEIRRRIEETIEKYDLSASGDTFGQTFACPLFEKGIGCLVHSEGKPLPCIQHACYERREDLPPDDLQTEREIQVEKLNKWTYGKSWSWLPLPVWLSRLSRAVGR